jgi:hypothetical protein
VSERLFTPEEVDRLLPQLTELLDVGMERYRQAVALQERLREDRARVAASGGERVDAPEWKARAERLDGLRIEVRHVIGEIQALGGVVKDLETGLVDFPGRGPGEHRERVVNLCWRYGERAVEFWHGMDEGFAQRKPLA